MPPSPQYSQHLRNSFKANLCSFTCSARFTVFHITQYSFRFIFTLVGRFSLFFVCLFRCAQHRRNNMVRNACVCVSATAKTYYFRAEGYSLRENCEVRRTGRLKNWQKNQNSSSNRMNCNEFSIWQNAAIIHFLAAFFSSVSILSVSTARTTTVAYTQTEYQRDRGKKATEEITHAHTDAINNNKRTERKKNIYIRT